MPCSCAEGANARLLKYEQDYRRRTKQDLRQKKCAGWSRDASSLHIIPILRPHYAVAANQVADATDSEHMQYILQEPAKRSLPSKQAFWSYPMPVLVAFIHSSFINFKVVGPTMTI